VQNFEYLFRKSSGLVSAFLYPQVVNTSNFLVIQSSRNRTDGVSGLCFIEKTLKSREILWSLTFYMLYMNQSSSMYISW